MKQASSGVLSSLFGDLTEPPQRMERSHAGRAPYGIGALAERLGVPPRRIRRWIAHGWFPETPHWVEGNNGFSHQRRFSWRMIDAAERIAGKLGLLGKRRWDLAESEFGDEVAQAWWRSEHDRVDPSVAWCGVRGWPEANPKNITDFSTPEALRKAAIARLPTPDRPDHRVIDMTTDEARLANNAGRPIYLTRT